MSTITFRNEQGALESVSEVTSDKTLAHLAALLAQDSLGNPPSVLAAVQAEIADRAAYVEARWAELAADGYIIYPTVPGYLALKDGQGLAGIPALARAETVQEAHAAVVRAVDSIPAAE